MDEDYYKNLKCPVCGNLYNLNNILIERMHFTTCSFGWGVGVSGLYSSVRIAYCHIGKGFVQFNTDGKHHQVTEPHPNLKLLIEMVSNTNRSETDIEQFVTNHKFNNIDSSDIDILSQHKVYNIINNQVYQTINQIPKKPKSLKCKLGLHQYIQSEYDILLICSKCHKAKIDWKKVPIFNKTTGEMITYD